VGKRATIGRSGRPVKDPGLSGTLSKQLHECCRANSVKPLTPKCLAVAELVATTKPNAFGMAENMSFYSTEVERMASLRVQLTGTRCIYMMQLQDIDTVLNAKTLSSEKKNKRRRMRSRSAFSSSRLSPQQM
jgi:hypothetical protein